jgi:hypothetical protein
MKNGWNLFEKHVCSAIIIIILALQVATVAKSFEKTVSLPEKIFCIGCAVALIFFQIGLFHLRKENADD